MLGRPGTIGAGGVGSGPGTPGTEGAAGIAGTAGGAGEAPGVGNNGIRGGAGGSGAVREGSEVKFGVEGNRPGVGRTDGGIAMFGAGKRGVLVVEGVGFGGGVVFFGPNIRANSPGFLGGSCDWSGMVAAPAEVLYLDELLD